MFSSGAQGPQGPQPIGLRDLAYLVLMLQLVIILFRTLHHWGTYEVKKWKTHINSVWAWHQQSFGFDLWDQLPVRFRCGFSPDAVASVEAQTVLCWRIFVGYGFGCFRTSTGGRGWGFAPNHLAIVSTCSNFWNKSMAKGHRVTETCFELASAGLPVWYAPMGLRWSAADGSALCSAYEQQRGPAQAPINAWAGPGVAASQVPVKGKGSPAPGCDGKDGAGASHQGVEGGKMWKDVERCGKMWKVGICILVFACWTPLVLKGFAC